MDNNVSEQIVESIDQLAEIRNLIKKNSISLKTIAERMEMNESTFKLKLSEEPYAQQYKFKLEEIEKLKLALKELANDIGKVAEG